MKKLTSIISAMALVTAFTSVPFAASAADTDVLYGTMNIPYADFYANEVGIDYEVDAVSSATTTKWASNAEGGLVQGTFNEANADGTGRILGVVYPVAISQADLDALGDNNYGFAALEAAPTAYKEVTVENGVASFSAVVDDEVENAVTTLTVEPSSHWGDYCVTVDNLSYERGAVASSIGKLYGCIVTDTDGNQYAMRHLENIWKNEIGINVRETTDAHGVSVSYANYTGLHGAKIDSITYITENGYYIYDVDPDAYLCKLVDGGIEVADATVTAGKTIITENLPSDYAAEYTVEGINGAVNDGVLTYSDAVSGSYTVTASDKNGVYESVSATFTLSTDTMPAAYKDGAVVKADGADDADFANFMKNIATVSVNGTNYAASGRGSTKIIGEDGKIDTTVSSGGSNIFGGDGKYEMTVTATGYTNSLTFTLEIGGSAEQPTTNQSASTTAGNKSTTASNKSTTTTANSASDKSASPKTGDAGVAVPVALTAIAVAAVVITKKKNG